MKARGVNMSKIYKNRYYIAFICALSLSFLAIVGLHSYYNMQGIIRPASGEWGRSTSLGAMDLFKKQPSFVVDDQYANVLTANKKNFTAIKLNRTTREKQTQIIAIKGVESSKVQKFEWDIENIYFIESRVLYFASKNPSGGYSAKVKIADEVLDFELINNLENAVLVTAHSDGVVIYKRDNNGFVQATEKYKVPTISNVAAVLAKDGVLHVAAFGEVNSIDFPMYYLTNRDNTWSLKGHVTERSISESWTVNSIDIGLDDTDAYIFYDMIKWDKRGLAAKVYSTTVPLNQDKAALEFEQFYMRPEDRNDPSLFLNEPRISKTQGQSITLSIVRNTYDKKYAAGFSAFQIDMDNGKVINVARATRNQRLTTNSTFQNYKGDNIYIFMDAAGGFDYEAFYTETGKPYYENSQVPTKEDYQIALMDTIPGYVSTFLVSFIKFTLYFPVIIWFLVIEFFEIRKLKERPKLVYYIGFGLYLIMKLVTFGNYYSAVSIPQMPPVLAFAGAKYVFAVGIAVLAVLIQKLLKKHNPEMHLIAEYIVFALIDIELTNLLYATYMV